MGVQFGRQKYLWGNIPAFDVLQLGSNESEEYGDELHLLFAGEYLGMYSTGPLLTVLYVTASGDLRNVVQTIAQLPSKFNQSIHVAMNDRDIDIVARNAIMLLIALVVESIDEAIECTVHVWYSAVIRKSDIDILQQQIRPLIENVCEKIKTKSSSALLGKTWRFEQRSLRLVLEKSSWNSLLSYMSIPEGLTVERANKLRIAVALADSRKDYRDRSLLLRSPSHRIAKNRFWEDGLLLSFGFPRHEFQVPNP